jgi:hypothetical protein
MLVCDQRDLVIAKREGDRRSRMRTDNWLVDLDFPNANTAATADVDV